MGKFHVPLSQRHQGNTDWTRVLELGTETAEQPKQGVGEAGLGQDCN